MIATLIGFFKVFGLRALTGFWAAWLSPLGRVLIQGGIVVALIGAAWWWWEDTKADWIAEGRRAAESELRAEIAAENKQAEQEADERANEADRAAAAVPAVPERGGDLERLCERDPACRDRAGG